MLQAIVRYHAKSQIKQKNKITKIVFGYYFIHIKKRK